MLNSNKVMRSKAKRSSRFISTFKAKKNPVLLDWAELNGAESRASSLDQQRTLFKNDVESPVRSKTSIRSPKASYISNLEASRFNKQKLEDETVDIFNAAPLSSRRSVLPKSKFNRQNTVGSQSGSHFGDSEP